MVGSPPTSSDRRRWLPLWSGSSKSMKGSPAAGRWAFDGIVARVLSFITLQRYSLLRLRAETRRGHEPLSAETNDALPVRLVGPRIAGKRGQGPVVVGDLLAARSGDDAKLAR